MAGGEPGAERIGQLLQSLRREQRQSVETVAARAGLSVGTIRAIEQGRRAPSEESGLRLLRALLPEGSVVEKCEEIADSGGLPGYLFTDPRSGSQVFLAFRARTAGDNRRWSSDGPRVGETRAEVLLRDIVSNPVRSAQMMENLKPALALFASAAESARNLATQPATDAELGGIVRRLAVFPGQRIWRLERLLVLWDRVDSDKASGSERDLDARVTELLEAYRPIVDGEVL